MRTTNADETSSGRTTDGPPIFPLTDHCQSLPPLPQPLTTTTLHLRHIMANTLRKNLSRWRRSLMASLSNDFCESRVVLLSFRPLLDTVSG